MLGTILLINKSLFKLKNVFCYVLNLSIKYLIIIYKYTKAHVFTVNDTFLMHFEYMLKAVANKVWVIIINNNHFI